MKTKELYKFFKFNGKVVNITDYNPETLKVFSREVLKMIGSNKIGWETMLPSGVAEIIKKKNLFGFKSNATHSNLNV